MRRLSESIFNAGVERNQGNEIKREDDISGSNFKEIGFIEYEECSVLWSDRNLEVGNRDTFEKDEISFPKGYRYPTEIEFEELIGKTNDRIYQNNIDGKIYTKDIYFTEGHYFLEDKDKRIEVGVSIDHKNIMISSHWAGWDHNKKYKIRLVKEK